MGTANHSLEVEAALAATGAIAKSHVLRWMRDGDLPTRSRVCRLTYSAWPRIQPEVTTDEHFGFVAEYLLECLASNPNDDDEFLHSGWEAGHAIQSWLKYLVTVPEGRSIISGVATRLEELYRAGDAATRTRIEQGALEHILEKPSLRPYFSHWQTDPVLREAYEPALLWGLEHTDKP